MTDYVLGIDAGGTYFKSVLIKNGIEVVKDTALKTPSGSSKDEILKCYCEIIKFARHFVSDVGGRLIGIGVSTPGPFDYKNGISLMQHKLTGIYGVNLKKSLKDMGMLGDMPMGFLHDGPAFLLGEYLLGSGNGFKNIACITLGTGTGFAVMKNGKLCLKENGDTAFSIYGKPLNGLTVEDFLSHRGIINFYKKLSGFENDIDVYGIELAATQNNDKFAFETFKKTGEFIAKAVKDILVEEKIECLILGGQISKGFPLMEETLKDGLSDVASLKSVIRGADLDFSPQIGAVSLIFNGDEKL